MRWIAIALTTFTNSTSRHHFSSMDKANMINPFGITLTGYMLKSARTHTSDLSNGIGGRRSCVFTHTKSADGLVFTKTAKKHALDIYVMLLLCMAISCWLNWLPMVIQTKFTQTPKIFRRKTSLAQLKLDDATFKVYQPSSPLVA